MYILYSCLLLLPLASGQGMKDLVTNLPGLQFQTNFSTYSGYLNANTKGTWKMHYMLTESKSNPATDPLLVWFNGGPGCSSYAGLFEELGPFQINYDGATLYENVFSWNAKANVLYLESPIGVGYSYDTEHDSYSTANDDQTLSQNFQALTDFFIRVQPQYASRQFFLSGESYAGIYIPMLSKAVVQAINNGSFPNPNFQGAAIGNGFMNVKYLLNSLVLWGAYHGRVSVQDWDTIKTSCKTDGATDVDSYDFSQNMWSRVGNGIDFEGNPNTTCGKLINQLITMPDNMYPYNYYEDCYEQSLIESVGPPGPPRRRDFQGTQGINKNTALLLNRISTDSQWGYPCWNEEAMVNYSNRKDVLDALHIDDGWRKQNNSNFQWSDCNYDIYNNYHITHNDTYQFFDYVLKNVKVPNFRFLIYNGDVDTVCNYLGDAWHIRDVAKIANLTTDQRKEWFFSQNNQIAGFTQRYSGKSGQGTPLSIDVLTVKGAGHMVPNDRPGPSCQMITNFLFPTANGVDYSTGSIDTNPTVSPLLVDNSATTVSVTTASATTTSATTTSVATASVTTASLTTASATTAPATTASATTAPPPPATTKTTSRPILILSIALSLIALH